MATNAYPVESVGEAFLVLMKRRGVDHFFVNAGTDSASLVEAYARQPSSGLDFPKPVVCTHENLAVGMAHGYTMVTGRPQAVMLHVSVGAANAVCALMNAARDNIPMLFTAGRTPLFEQGRRGARNVPIHWAQEMFDQAGMLREIVKWDYELRDGTVNLEDIVDRALAVTSAPPQGPVYLTLPREVLATEMRELVLEREALAVPSEPAPDPRAVEQLAALIAAAEFPVIATATAGRRATDVPVLAALCEAHGIGVVETHARFLGLPSSHPMHLGIALKPHFAQADLIIVLEADVPWMPSVDGAPRTGCRVVHAGVDPLFSRYPVRGFGGELAITATTTTLLPALAAALGARSAGAEARRARIMAASRAMREARAARIAALKAAPRMNKDWMNICLNDAKPADATVVNEYWSTRGLLDCEAPGSFFHHPPAAGLGWGMPAALGVQLAQPGRTVIAALGDGAYMFANPASCHQAAAAMELPILTILCNNARWHAVQNAAQTLYPDGHAAKHATPVPLADLSPTPAFETYAEASGGYGEVVSDPEALPGAIARALRVVREEKRQALLNVLSE
jgi:acetolactate synthase-1/2/3 large subunit